MRKTSRVAAAMVVASATFVWLLVSQGVVAAGSPTQPALAPSDTSSTELRVLSNRADLISGGDALVEVVLPEGANPSKVQVAVGGRDVTSAFRVRPDGRFLGMVDGLAAGENLLTARGPGGSADLAITNHPIGGPVFSGPQVQPWRCETAAAGLGIAQDEQCNAAAQVEYFYKSKLTGAFEPYARNDPPPSSQVATTTTDQGKTVPYVIREETGTVNRGIYRFAVLVDPSRPALPWSAQPWNHKLVYPFVGGVAPNRRQGTLIGSWPGRTREPGEVLDESATLKYKDLALSRGFAVATATLNILGQNSNTVTSAETVMMVKELLIERFGQVRYTIGAGCSGGSIQQHLIADSYPGLLDGIQPGCSFMDLYTTNNELSDCSLLDRVYDEESPYLWAVTAQSAVVNGHADEGPCRTWDQALNLDQTSMDPRVGCVGGTVNPAPTIPEDDYVYDAQTNPDGVRCTLQDYQVAMFGQRLPESWGPVEQRIGRGFANRPFDNVGVQYGLKGVTSGLITPEQFVSLNEEVGGYDIDGHWQPQRSVADARALEVAYRSGQVTSGRYLAQVPIIDLRGSSNHEIHTDFRSYAMRARLLQANGHHDNQIIWTAPLLTGDPAWSESAFLLIDKWLAAIEADRSDMPLASKVVKNKPAGAVDACWIGGREITEMSVCRAAFPYFGNPRIAAGGKLVDNVLKCQLVPLDRSDYNVDLTNTQWQRLQDVFPSGVCDYSKPSVGFGPSIPWLTYADGPGGRPLGPPPSS